MPDPHRVTQPRALSATSPSLDTSRDGNSNTSPGSSFQGLHIFFCEEIPPKLRQALPSSPSHTAPGSSGLPNTAPGSPGPFTQHRAPWDPSRLFPEGPAPAGPALGLRPPRPLSSPERSRPGVASHQRHIVRPAAGEFPASLDVRAVRGLGTGRGPRRHGGWRCRRC